MKHLLLAAAAVSFLTAGAVAAEENPAPAKYIVTSGKSVADAAAAVERAAKGHQFGVLHVHDIQAKLQEKGIEFPHPCRVLEICNPKHAARVLAEDMDLSLLLPCRISVYEKDGTTHIGMVRPTALLGAFSTAAELKPVAEEVEAATVAIINDAK